VRVSPWVWHDKDAWMLLLFQVWWVYIFINELFFMGLGFERLMCEQPRPKAQYPQFNFKSFCTFKFWTKLNVWKFNEAPKQKSVQTFITVFFSGIKLNVEHHITEMTFHKLCKSSIPLWFWFSNWLSWEFVLFIWS